MGVKSSSQLCRTELRLRTKTSTPGVGCVSVRQTTTLVVRGLGRAFLCLSVCLSLCPKDNISTHAIHSTQVIVHRFHANGSKSLSTSSTSTSLFIGMSSISARGARRRLTRLAQLTRRRAERFERLWRTALVGDCLRLLQALDGGSQDVTMQLPRGASRRYRTVPGYGPWWVHTSSALANNTS